MRAIIQAGGKGTRLRNITNDEFPKPMVPIMGKPLLQWQIEELRENGINEIFIIVGYLGHVIQNYFEDGGKYGVSITYIVEKKPLGTGGGLYYLKKYIEEQEIFFFIYGDVFFHLDLKRMLQFHLCRKSSLTALVHPNEHPFDSDLLELDENGKIISLLSKNKIRNIWYENQVNAAFYLINAKIIMELKTDKKLDFEKDILQLQINHCEDVYGYHSTEYVRDAGTEGRLKSIESDIVSGYIEKRNLKNKQKCIFLDRDGTINKKNGFISAEEQFELIDGVANAIRRINHSEYLAIIITNQPVVARGMCSIERIEQIHRKLQTLLGEQGAYLDDISYCPHHPDKGYAGENPDYKIACECRKPSIGMLKQMAKKYNISLEDSWMIGDTTVDIMTGKNAVMRTGLVLTGDAGRDGKYSVQADIEGNSLYELVNIIINNK